MLPFYYLSKTQKTDGVERVMEEKEQNVSEKQPEQKIQPSSKTLREEISELKSKLNEFGQKKEEWFKKKEDLKQDIANLIVKIKEARTNKEQVDNKIKELRDNRDKFNKEVHELIVKIKEFNKKPETNTDRMDRPEFIKSQMNKLETALETQAFDFEKEKKVMKQINDLKKKYDKAVAAYSSKKEMHELSKKIEEAKKKADEFHNLLKEYLKEHKENSFGRLSKEINQIKKIQEDAFANFIKYKQEFANVNKVLKEKLELFRREHEKYENVRKERQKESISREERQIRNKAKEVKEKFKEKKILTTEDIITLQGEPIDTEEF